jgi:hypothetical protein
VSIETEQDERGKGNIRITSEQTTAALLSKPNDILSSGTSLSSDETLSASNRTTIY